MPSLVDASKPVDGSPVPKSELRANFSATRTELNHGGFVNDPTTGLEAQTTNAIGTIYAALRNRSSHLGTEPDAAISESAVKQHEAALIIEAGQLTGTVNPAQLPLNPAQVQVISAGIGSLTAEQQAQIGQGTLVTDGDKRYVYKGTGSKTVTTSYIEVADLTPDWSLIANKPTTFAPSSHTHPASQISDAGAGGISVLQATTAAAIRTFLNVEDNAAADQNASEVPFSPTGNIAATTVQSALAELDTEKAASSHTHASTAITDFSEAVDDRVAALLVQGANVTLNYNDASNTLTISATGGGGGGTELPVADTTTIVKGSADATKLLRIEVDGLTTETTRVLTMADQNVDLTPGQTFAPASHSHPASQISDSGAAGRSMLQADTAAAQRTLLNVEDGATADQNASEVPFSPTGNIAANNVQSALAELDTEKSATGHTHTASNVTDFAEAVDDRVAALLVQGANVTLTYDDVANTLTIASTGGGGGTDWTVDQGATNIHAGNIPDLSATYQPRDTDLDAWAGKTAPTGVVVGTTDTQTLTGKSIDSAQLTGTIDPARLPVLPSSVQIVSSGGIANLTVPQQDVIGDGSVVTTTDGRRWVYIGTGSKTVEGSYIELADITPEWAVVANKPSFATVATSGAYADLSGKPTLGTASDNAETDFATAAQGALADTALQPTLTDSVNANDQQIQSAVLVDTAELSPAASVSGAVTRSFAAGSLQEITLIGNVTSLMISNPPPSGNAGTITFLIKQDTTGGRTWAHPSGIVWIGGSAPTLATAPNAITVISYMTRDAGTTWYGFSGGATAADIVATAHGNIAATTVQGQLQELETEKAPLASPAFTGNPTELYADAGNKTGAASFVYTSGSWQKCVATGNITSVAITSAPASGRVATLVLEIHQDATGGRTIAWGTAFRFPAGTDSTLSAAANAVDIFTLVTRDGGTTWYVHENGKAWAA